MSQQYMLQSVSSVFIMYRCKTPTGSPDPTHANGMNKPCTPIIVNGEETACLVDTGATVTVIDEAYCQKMGLEIQPITVLVKLIGTSGSLIRYSGYVIATVTFPHIPNYEEDVAMLVIRDKTTWAERVSIQIGTRVIAAERE